MTKKEFWKSIADSIYVCTHCPAKPDKNNNCRNGCAKTLQETYERLERESNEIGKRIKS